MYCINCGHKNDENAKFCIECGINLINSECMTNCSKSEDPCIDVYFLPKKTIGQFLVRKATIKINDKAAETKFKRALKLELVSGETEIYCYSNYLGKSGKATLTYNFEKGKTYLIKYRCPIIIFFPGKIQVSECHIDPKGRPIENK